MIKVLGIGGFIFRAKDPKALASWYKNNLGIDRNKWEQQAGPTAFTSVEDPEGNRIELWEPEDSV